MLDLEGLEEYNNVGALFGLDGLDGNEFLGALQKMNPVKRQQVINKLANNSSSSSRGSRKAMEKHFEELPAHIKAGIADRSLRLADTTIYSIKPINSKLIKFFETQDVKTIGLSALSAARLPKNQALMVYAITILVGVPADTTPEKVIAAKYNGVETYGALANGEFSLKANKKIIMPESHMAQWKTENITTIRRGYYPLDNPRIIDDDVLIEANIELGSMDGLTGAGAYVYIGLHGTITTP